MCLIMHISETLEIGKKGENQGFKMHSLEMSSMVPVIQIPLDENDSEALKTTENMQVFF